MNFKIRYEYDGYKYYDVISAETPEDACEYCKHLKRDGIDRIINCEETTEQTELIATQEELERIRTPFWKKEGAESAEEWCEYQAYCHENDEKAFQRALEAASEMAGNDDWDFEDLEYEVNTMSFEEWKKQK